MTDSDESGSVHKIIRKATIDLQQAANYYDNYQWPGYKKNLTDIIEGLEHLVADIPGKS